VSERPANDRSAERSSVTRRQVQRAQLSTGTLAAREPDDVAVEEPLEIRVAGDTLAVVMRTPGEDHYLASGFLHSEGIIQGLSDLGRVAHCGRPNEPGYGNLIDIAPGPGTALAPELVVTRRGTLANSACGVCGRERIDDLLARLTPLHDALRVSGPLIESSLERLRAQQTAFARTGGMHGAIALAADGGELAISEDVGRHNAVDKVIGKLLYADLLAPGKSPAALLGVSGRASFEIVQKAASARIPIVVCVSAPTSLAIDLAAALGLTLIGFTRGSDCNIYTHPERVLLTAAS
jgi:FdhD protein